MPALEAVPVRLRRRRDGIAGQVRRIRGEHVTDLVVQDRGHDVRVGSEGGEDLSGVGLVGKGQGGGAVGGDDPTADGQSVARCLP